MIAQLIRETAKKIGAAINPLGTTSNQDIERSHHSDALENERVLQKQIIAGNMTADEAEKIRHRYPDHFNTSHR